MTSGNNQQIILYISWSRIMISADHLRVQLAEILERAPRASKSHPATSIPMWWSLPQNTLGYLRLPGKTCAFFLRACKFLGVNGWLPVRILHDWNHGLYSRLESCTTTISWNLYKAHLPETAWNHKNISDMHPSLCSQVALLSIGMCVANHGHQCGAAHCWEGHLV